MLMVGKLYYGREVPSAITKRTMLEVKANRINAFFERGLKFFRARLKHPWLKVTYNPDVFDMADSSVDGILYQLAARYTKYIARNDDYLSSMKIMANIPIIVLLMGLIIAGYLTPSPKSPPHQPSSTQSSSPAPTQVKPRP